MFFDFCITTIPIVRHFDVDLSEEGTISDIEGT
jgi:hypothetical protein